MVLRPPPPPPAPKIPKYTSLYGSTIILKLLSAVLLFAVALPVNEIVVEELTSFGSPVITPVEELILRPAPVSYTHLTLPTILLV